MGVETQALLAQAGGAAAKAAGVQGGHLAEQPCTVTYGSWRSLMSEWVSKVLEAMRVRGMPRVYVLGSLERRVTIYSQQVRALNLVDALVRADKLRPETRIAVIGAGSAGLTFAAGALLRSAQVTVIEQESEPLSLFRYGAQRWLHPRVYDWPLSGWEYARAGLPVLDWEAGTVPSVRDQQLRGWRAVSDQHRDRLRVVLHASGVVIPDGTEHDEVMVSWNVESPDAPAGPETFDVVVLAVGFGRETAEMPSYRTYWEPDDIDDVGSFREGIDAPKTWLVSGCGDGALTDLLRLCIRGFRHERMVVDFASDRALEAVKQQIAAIEEDNRAKGDDGIRFLFGEYRKLRFEPLISSLRDPEKWARQDTKVTLNTADGYFLRSNSSPLNRFLVAQLHHARRFELFPDSVKPPVSAEGERRRVTFASGHVRVFDRVLLRHGPRLAALEAFPAVWKACEPMRELWKQTPTLLDQTRTRFWDEGIFGPEERFEARGVASLPAASAPPGAPVGRKPKLFGREALLKEAATRLQQRPVLLVYGLRGTGKSAFIEGLARVEPLAGRERVRLTAGPYTTASEIFRYFAPILGETAELPQVPTGDDGAIRREIGCRYPNPRSAWVWIDMAHHLLDERGFRSPDVARLLVGLCAALGKQCPVVLELREKPPEALLRTLANVCHVPGLDKQSLEECLRDGAPDEQQSRWSYKGTELKRLYHWLGGGHGNQAHPLAIQLLIEVARGHGETPLDVLNRHRGDFEQKVEEVLLADLFNNVLNEPERRMLRALALYRSTIPHDHADALERHLGVAGAWDGLDRRCLLASSPEQSQYYLHSFISGWLRTCMGYVGHGEDTEADGQGFKNASVEREVRALHAVVARCWLDQLMRSRRVTQQNIGRALEAFHHLVAAGEPGRIQDIAVELLTGNRAWAIVRIERLYEYLFKSRAPVHAQRLALEYWATLEPENHKVQRFLGECWVKEEGWTSAKALRCFEEACRLEGNFAPYWSNLGKALLAQGKEGAKEFLARLAVLEEERPRAVDDHVRAIQAHCLSLVGHENEAAAVRMAKIRAGSRDAVFYADEAKARLEAGNAAGALEVLDLAEKNGCTDEFTTAIRANALAHCGRDEEAAAVRMAKIRAGSRHAAFYADEAKARLEAGNAAGALEVLDLAERNGCTNEFTTAIRANALAHCGRDEEAAAVRMAKIRAGSRNAAFYADEAKVRLEAGNAAGALEVLDLAEKNGCIDEFTTAIRANALARCGRNEEAAAVRMAKIRAGSRNAAFYADEAKVRLEAGNAAGALEVLDLAEKNGCTGKVTDALRVKALDRLRLT
ncbi:hypothetical protein WME76_17000 [Sorangium sp. So ce119]|uniref:hypothetical protein n=1 Tax=Sorangium sp. So ce119 TaxID=3133279 RepID=UPI003F636A17